ncbi:MAG: trypsin-like peptidase domain-containing protein [Gemmatimonadota bacterium]|nr:trypsin-like peptidase domain-containing protein [Gemmatimonadota bacterium]
MNNRIRIILLCSVLALLFLISRETRLMPDKPELPQQPGNTTVRAEIDPLGSYAIGTESLWAAPVPETSSRARMLDSLQNTLSQGRRNSVVRASERVAPTVVSINVIKTKMVTTMHRDFFGLFYVPSHRKVENLGSGFIFNPRGYILTNEHVVHEASEVSVTTAEGKNYPAEIVGTDPKTDLAILRIDPGGRSLPAAPLGDSDDLYIGEWAIALGSPFGMLLDDPQPTVTVGVISAIGRDIRPSREKKDAIYANMIQTDASINPGNSGGPLVNASGEVIGINTSIFSPSGGSVGIGFAIPINRAKQIAEELIRGGKVRKPWLGIKVQDLGPDLLRSMGYSSSTTIQGVLVSGVDHYSPAGGGKVQVGDIITHISDHVIRSSNDWSGEMIDIRVGKPVRIRIMRFGRTVDVRLVPVEQSIDLLERHNTGIGFEVVDLTGEVRSQLGIRVNHGAVVVRLTNPELDRTGSILEHDVLYQVNRTRITGAAQAVRVLERLPRGKPAVLILERNGRRVRRYLTD